MGDRGDKKNPLQTKGTSQPDRFLPALKSDYAKVDERNYADWITFANKFGEHLNFFDETGKITTNWSAFFTHDISSALASIAVQDIHEYKYQLKKRLDYLRDDDNKLNSSDLKRKLNELFSALFTLSKALDEYSLKLSPELALKQSLFNLINTKLAQPLNRLIGYYKAAKDCNYLLPLQDTGWSILNRKVEEAEQLVFFEGLSKSWYAPTVATWDDYVDSIEADESIFVLPNKQVPPLYAKIEHAANHNLFTGVFDQYLFIYTKVIHDAAGELLKTLESYEKHTPHYALFLTFLKLFRFSQDQANTLTKRHLDFYYREVLQLKAKTPQPDYLHVLLELAKRKQDHVLPAATLFKAGKDSSGKNVFYALEEDTVFNKATVASLKAVYRASEKDSIKNPLNEEIIEENKGRLFAAPVANSADGLGAEIKTPQKEWHPYVKRKFEEGSLKAIAMPKAEIGFAVASHHLFLSEGERVIKVLLKTQPIDLPDNLQLECYLTTEREWLKVDAKVQYCNHSTSSDESESLSQISIELSADNPAIERYYPAVHGGLYNLEVPLLKVYLPQEKNLPYLYEDLLNLSIEKVKVQVEVGSQEKTYSQTGLKDLYLFNNFGPLDSSRSFMPFGSQPSKNSSFIIGHRELFGKGKASFALNIEWANYPESKEPGSEKATVESKKGGGDKFVVQENKTTNNIAREKGSAEKRTQKPATADVVTYPYVNVQFLKDGKWDGNINWNIFGNRTVSLFSNGLKIPSKSLISFDQDYTYSSKSVAGFMRLMLTEDFGHKEYIAALTEYLIDKANDTCDSGKTRPVEPYTPTIQSIYLNYSACVERDFKNEQEGGSEHPAIHFFHLYPFGEAEQHTFSDKNNDVKLFPQFNHKNPGAAPVQHQGEFYIGIEKLEPGQGVNLLFQLMEGSTDPFVVKPPNHIHWSFLSNNQWLNFKNKDIQDATLGLVQTGIISFAIPEEATTNNTLLPPGRIWIRASVESAAAAICKVISIDAQAAKLIFFPHENAGDFLDTPLPPGSVTKLKNPDSGIKKINQPYSSFGGKPKENDEKFYVRVSERLRHKNRAVTVWDYERLVLEAFPEIYKVKCLNHTWLDKNKEGMEVLNETRPGNVLLITIPQLHNLNDANPLKPYTNQGTLSKIELFLKERISCHVSLKVVQPQFEEVRLKFKLKLREGLTDFTFYTKRLQEAITHYLTPWASGPNVEIRFEGIIYKSAIINVIEEQPYVDYITQVELFVKPQENGPESEDQEIVTASTARSILVSAPARRHEISPVGDE